MVLPLEAVADAIMHYEGWTPGSVSNRNRNPGNLRGSPLQSGEDPAGFSTFRNLPAGYDALLHELESKFSGQNEHGIGPDSTLLDLFAVYAPSSDGNVPLKYAAFVATWVTHVLNRTISPSTRLGDICEMPAPELPLTSDPSR